MNSNSVSADSQKLRLRVIKLSIVMGILILGLKTIAYLKTGSSALKSDAIESLVNIAAAFFAWGAVIFAEKPADKDHPYGHGKIEHFSAAFEGGLISLAAAVIVFETSRNIYAGLRATELDVGIYFNLAGGLLNGILGTILVRTGKKTNSRAIEADGYHVLSDFMTTLAIGAGLLVVYLTGYYWLDYVMAYVVAGLLAWTGFRLVGRSSNALLDIEEPDTLQKIVDQMNVKRTSDIIAVHELRTMRSGRHTHVDVHVVVPEFVPLREAHDNVEMFGMSVLSSLGIQGEFHSHVDPCRKLYCEECSKENCIIRASPFKAKKAFSVEGATAAGPDEVL